MAWELRIHVIDVGQGESTLIHAWDATGTAVRSMLIDGGEGHCAKTVYKYVKERVTTIDRIVISHYDKDHSGGIVSLLLADNLYRLADFVAELLVQEAGKGTTRAERIAGAAGGLTAAMMGARSSVKAGRVGNKARDAVKNKRLGDQAAAEKGVNGSIDYAMEIGDPKLAFFKRRSPKELEKLVHPAAKNAVDALLNGGDARKAARDAIFEALKPKVDANSRFKTGGMFHRTKIYDLGSSKVEKYARIADGCVKFGSTWIQVPGLDRDREEVMDLGEEILWEYGQGIALPPAQAPFVYIVAANTEVWKKRKRISGSQPDNNISIGLILRFNNFFYYSGGDLPSDGDELIIETIKQNGLPNPAVPNTTFPRPTRIASFKCGHHGAESSTSPDFLKEAKPSAAFISCGKHGKFQHPTEAVISRLHKSPYIQYFFLTNCNFVTPLVPASSGRDQLTKVGNKSRVAGDNNNANNLAPTRDRGDIKIRIDESESVRPANDALRQFHVRYFDNDTGVEQRRTEDISF